MTDTSSAGKRAVEPNRPLKLVDGTVVDGSGGEPRKANVLLRGERIEDVGAISPAPDWETIDCSGLHIEPRFIDVHSHGDQEILEHLPNKVLQGGARREGRPRERRRVDGA